MYRRRGFLIVVSALTFRSRTSQSIRRALRVFWAASATGAGADFWSPGSAAATSSLHAIRIPSAIAGASLPVVTIPVPKVLL